MSLHGRVMKQVRGLHRYQSGHGNSLLSRAFASQTGSYVIASAGIRGEEDVPDRYAELNTKDHTGESYIIDPRGEIIAGPGEGETILLAQGSMEAVMAAKMAADIAGHYSRPDQLQLYVDGQPLERLRRKERSAERSNLLRTGQSSDEQEEPQITEQQRVA